MLFWHGQPDHYWSSPGEMYPISGPGLLRDPPVLPYLKQEEPHGISTSQPPCSAFEYVLCAPTSPAVRHHEETLTYLNQERGARGLPRPAAAVLGAAAAGGLAVEPPGRSHPRHRHPALRRHPRTPNPPHAAQHGGIPLGPLEADVRLRAGSLHQHRVHAAEEWGGERRPLPHPDRHLRGGGQGGPPRAPPLCQLPRQGVQAQGGRQEAEDGPGEGGEAPGARAGEIPAGLRDHRAGRVRPVAGRAGCTPQPPRHPGAAASSPLQAAEPREGVRVTRLCRREPRREHWRGAEPLCIPPGDAAVAAQAPLLCLRPRLRQLRRDLIRICGAPDGIRLCNALTGRCPRPRLTLYVSRELAGGAEGAEDGCSGLYQEMHLEELTVAELTGKLAELLGLPVGQILRVSRQGPSGIHILVSDVMIRNLLDETCFVVAISKVHGPEGYRLVLR
ncbi:translation initiation factor IF-2-like isoform X3 [Grus americana]|uniref:translation initiation factor IF-2-like isoform X3 n=1 Tax=Grus americana TaxID=9117 RepID=UPI0024085F6C|nr:translation initiation factor IF-2-like isoform X3 [Grus americana]